MQNAWSSAIVSHICHPVFHRSHKRFRLFLGPQSTLPLFHRTSHVHIYTTRYKATPCPLNFLLLHLSWCVSCLTMWLDVVLSGKIKSAPLAALVFLAAMLL